MSFRFQIFICLCFLFLYGSAVCFNELSTFAILKFQAKLCPLIPSVDNSCFNWTLPASYYQLSSHWDVWIELLLMKLKFGQKGNNFTNLTFFITDTIVLCVRVSELSKTAVSAISFQWTCVNLQNENGKILYPSISSSFLTYLLSANPLSRDMIWEQHATVEPLWSSMSRCKINLKFQSQKPPNSKVTYDYMT